MKASPPDYSDYGCGPSGAFDLSLGTGWNSEAPGPRSIVVRLPRAVDISSFGFDPGNTCGDGPGAATRTFTIYTKTGGGGWVLAYSGGKLKTGRLNTLIPSTGKSNVRFVKFMMLRTTGTRSSWTRSNSRSAARNASRSYARPAAAPPGRSPIRRRRSRRPRRPRAGRDRRPPSGCRRPRRTPRRAARTRPLHTSRAGARRPRPIPGPHRRGSAGWHPSPLMPGRFTSIRTRSGASSAAIATESSPDLGLAHDVEPLRGIHHHAGGHPEGLLVVDDQHANGHRLHGKRPTGHGRTPVVPAPLSAWRTGRGRRSTRPARPGGGTRVRAGAAG